MTVRLYLRDVENTNAPPTGDLSVSKSPFSQLSGPPYENRSLLFTKGSAQTVFQLTFGANNGRMHYSGRWVSPPLKAGSIGAVAHSGVYALRSNSSSSSRFNPTIYFYRPSTNSVVGFIVDASGASGSNYNTAAETGFAWTTAGYPVSGVTWQDGDVLVVEMWTHIATTGTRSIWIWFDGTTDPVDGVGTSDAASYYDFPGTLIPIGVADVPTRVRISAPTYRDVATKFGLYIARNVATRATISLTAFRDVATRVALLATIRDLATRVKLGAPIPSSGITDVFYLRDIESFDAPPPGSNATALFPVSAQVSGPPYENRSLLPQIGTAQTFYAAGIAGTGVKRVYVGRFTSPPLAAQHFNAGVWQYAPAHSTTSARTNARVNPQIYIWRPSTQSVVARIRNAAVNIPPNLVTTEMGWVYSLDFTNGGSAPDFDTLQGDVIVLENWFTGGQTSLGFHTRTLYFDGADVVTHGSSPTNAASWLKAPQGVVYGIPSPSVRTLVRINAGIFRDVATKLGLKIVVDIITRIVIINVRRYTDVRTLLWMRMAGYADIPTRFIVRFPGYRHVNTHIKLIYAVYLRDVFTRVNLRPLAFQDVLTRVTSRSWQYVNVFSRLILETDENIIDIETRVNVLAPTSLDTGTRVVIEAVQYAGLSRLDEDGSQIWFRGTF